MTSSKPQDNNNNNHRHWPSGLVLALNFGCPAVGDENYLVSKVGGKASPHLNSCELGGASAGTHLVRQHRSVLLLNLLSRLRDVRKCSQ